MDVVIKCDWWLKIKAHNCDLSENTEFYYPKRWGD